MNHKSPLTSQKKLRQAFQAALDMEPILVAGFGFARVLPARPRRSSSRAALALDGGAALYNQKDKEKAKRLLKEAGYAGQPLRWITTREYEFMYKNALVSKQQLEEVGIVVDLQVVDWATLNKRAPKPELWEIFSTGFRLLGRPGQPRRAPLHVHGWWCNEEKERLLADLRARTTSRSGRPSSTGSRSCSTRTWGSVKLGDYFTLDAARRELRRLPHRAAHVLLE